MIPLVVHSLRPLLRPAVRRGCRIGAAWLAAATLAVGLSPVGTAFGQNATPVFERDVMPIFTAHCFKCHGLEARKAGLDLRTVKFMLAGGDGGPALEPGSLENSPVHARVADRSMPPKGELPLTDAQIEVVRCWVAAGAPAASAEPAVTAVEAPAVTAEDRSYWAFRRPVRHEPPAVKNVAALRTPVDAFLLARLEAKGLGYSPIAEPRSLVRRAYFDLTGLPPSPEEIGEFQADLASAGFNGAYERLIDKLLASPHFGERWGRHWLDAAGYVDVVGSDNDAAIIKPGENKWLYRDYVVRAFDADMPFDRFLAEQLAGDELVDWRSAETFTPEILDSLIATGYLRAAVDDTDQKELNTADIRFRVLHLTVDILGTNLLGLTTACARCHSHKFDPIPQRDYYRMMALLTPAYNPQNWVPLNERHLPDVSPAEQAKIDAHNGSLDSQIGELRGQVAAAEAPARERVFDRKLESLPEPIRADVKVALNTPADRRSEVQKYLASKFDASLAIEPEAVAAALSDAEKPAVADLNRKIGELSGQKKSWGKLHALYDVGPPMPTFLLRRGDHQTPGFEVEAGFLTVLCDDEAGAVAHASAPTGSTSGRRLAFARWLTDGGTPAGGQLARVTVNRVWQQLFGVGIVPTAENFGHSGAPPTHPELLDWLATEFIQKGWKFKSLIRTLMLSRAYLQASSRTGLPAEIGAPDPEQADPGNELLWRSRLRRIESESVRDSILAVSGKLQRGVGGPPLLLSVQADGKVIVDVSKLAAPEQQWRRSLYVLARRNYHLSILNDFDQPAVATNCARRTPAAVVSQALTLLNDDLLLEQALHFARRVQVETAGAARDRQIGRAFELALGRLASPEEQAWSAELLDKQTRRYEAEAASPAPATEAAPKPATIGAGGFGANGQAAASSEPSAPPPPPAERALADLCHMLFSSSEFLYVP